MEATHHWCAIVHQLVTSFLLVDSEVDPIWNIAGGIDRLSPEPSQSPMLIEHRPSHLWCGHGNHAYVHVWCMDWRRWSPARFSKSRRRSKVDLVRVPEVEAKSNLSSGPVRSPGVVRNKTDTQVAYGVGFGRSIYWKHNFIELPMALVSCQNSSRVNRNLWNKLMSRICQGAAPIPLGLLAQQEAHVGLGYFSRAWTVPLGTVAPPLVTARGCVPYLDRPLIYFQTWVWFIC
jgi:hypothetical protein